MANEPPSSTVFQKRAVIAAALCVAAFALVGIRLVDVSILHGGGSDSHAGAPIFVPRGDLLDRNGEIMARDLPVQDLYAHPHAFEDRDEAARKLATATGASAARLLRVFNGPRNYALVERQLTPDAQDRVMSLGLPGLDFQDNGKRFYPEGRAAAQVIGVTDPDGKGVSGLEMGLNRRLASARRGEGIKTSIDMRVQYILSHEGGQARTDFNAQGVGGIVLDVRTGEVLGLASLPDFDPNVRTLGPEDSRRNIMVQDVYELGSVFKILSFTLAMEDHTIGLDDYLPIGSGLHVGRWTIHDAEHMPATLKARDVLAVSSNIGTAQIALRSGGVRQKQFLQHMGLLSPLRTELPESAFPLYPKDWGQIQTATIGFGQGISVSPLSYAAAVAAVVNGGTKIVPTFLKRSTPQNGERLIRADTSATMRGLLRYVVTNGTGRKANVPGYDVGGKTGSAQVPGPHGYQPHKLITSFCAVFPIDNPHYLVFVMIKDPHGTHAEGPMALAGHTAAPLAGRVIARIAPILGVPQEPVEVASNGSP